VDRLRRELANCRSRVQFKGIIFFIGLLADFWLAFFSAAENAFLISYIGLFGVGLWGMFWAEDLGVANRLRTEISLAESDD